MNALTPLYHKNLDSHGFCAGTRIWEASGNFVPVEDLKVGDFVFGITYRLETEYLPRNSNPNNKMDNFVPVWRPIMCARKVKGIKTVQARAWQLTFGDSDTAFEHRRLVAGAETAIHLFPLSKDRDHSPQIVDVQTALENPRSGSGTRQAMVLDHEQPDSLYRPTEFTGTARGDLAVIIPYDHYAGQTGMINVQERTYSRYLYTQIREVVPLLESTTLYQLELASDQLEDDPAPRCNVIAQTPFAPESKKRTIVTDLLAREVASTTGSDDFKQKWDAWAENQKVTNGPKQTIETAVQGMFYDSITDPKKAADLERRFGIKGGWLNGGILINIPIL